MSGCSPNSAAARCPLGSSGGLAQITPSDTQQPWAPTRLGSSCLRGAVLGLLREASRLASLEPLQAHLTDLAWAQVTKETARHPTAWRPGPEVLPLTCMGAEACLGQAPQEVAFREAAEPCTSTDLEPCPPERLPVTDTSLAAPHLSGVTPAQGPPSVSGSLA